MAEFVLLLHDEPAQFHKLAPAEMQAVFGRYKAWRDKNAQAGRLKGGKKLYDSTGRLMRAKNGSLSITDGPFAEAKEILGGLFIIEAESYEQAVEIAKDCPHLDFGTIEVRQVEVV